MKLKILAVLIALLVAWPVAADDVLNWDRMSAEKKAEVLKQHQRESENKRLKIEAKQRESKHISEIQQVLNQCGFNPGPIDGTWGNRTAKAAREFIRAHGLHPSNKRVVLMAQVDGKAGICPQNNAIDWERRWLCKGGLSNLGLEMELYQKKMPGKGRVVQDGIEIETDYRVEGLKRAWLWGVRDDQVYQYAITVHGREAYYYDFGTDKTEAESEAGYLCDL